MDGTRTFSRLTEALWLYHGAVNCAVLKHGDRGVLFDCCDSLDHNKLASIGVHRVDAVFLTQYRRPHVAGAHSFAEQGAVIFAPEKERPLIEAPERYWNDPKSRYGLFTGYRPYHQTPQIGLPCVGLSENDGYIFEGTEIKALSTPGPTDGSMSYLFALHSLSYAFSGALLLEGGRIPELYSLQKEDKLLGGYHGFFGAKSMVEASAQKLARLNPDVLLPSFGPPVKNVLNAFDAFRAKAEALMDNYVSTSAINFYFPDQYAENTHERMPVSPGIIMPDYILPCGEVSFLLRSHSGAAILFDCFREENLDAAISHMEEQRIKSIDHIFVTHYHYDHIMAIPEALKRFGADVWATDQQSDVLRHPEKYLLPCIENVPLPVVTLPSGVPFTWCEYTLTPFDFPGQTLYGDALLVEKEGERVFFVGDSFAPTGLDDYCAGNRNFLREETGLLSCLDLVEAHAPCLLVNQHQVNAFRFTDEQIKYMRKALRTRRALLADLAAQTHYEYATDEWWLRSYPFEQRVQPGESGTVSLMITNHEDRPMDVWTELCVPPGWEAKGAAEAAVTPLRSGLMHGPRPDGEIQMGFCVPKDAEKGRYVLPIRVSVNGRYMGAFRVAIVGVH